MNLKKFLILLFSLTVTFCCSLNAQNDSKNAVLINAGYLITSSEDDLDNTLGFAISYNYNFNQNVSLSAGLYYFSPSIESNLLPAGNIKLMPILINAIFAFNKDSFSPYITGGIAYFIVSYSLPEDTINAFNELGFDITSSGNNKLGINIGGGIYLKINPKYDLILDLRYFNAKATISNTIKDRITLIENEKNSDLSLGSILISGGVKFNF